MSEERGCHLLGEEDCDFLPYFFAGAQETICGVGATACKASVLTFVLFLESLGPLWNEASCFTAVFSSLEVGQKLPQR